MALPPPTSGRWARSLRTAGRRPRSDPAFRWDPLDTTSRPGVLGYHLDLGLGGGLFGGESTLSIWEAEPDRLWLLGGGAVREYTGLLPATTWDFYRDLRRYWSVGAAAGDHFYAVGTLGVVHELQRRGPGEAPVVSPLTVGDSRPLPLNLAGAVGWDQRRLLVWGSTLHVRDPWPFLVFSESGWERFPSLPPTMKPETLIHSVHQPAGTTQVVVAWDNFSDLGRGVHRWEGQQWQTLGSWEAPSADAPIPRCTWEPAKA